MGIQINGNTDTISATDGSLSIAGQELTGVTDINASGIITATSFVGDGSGLTGVGGTANVVTDSLVVAGVTTVSAGSTSAPSITPTGDLNTGIFFPAADTIAFGEGGAEAARFDSSGRLLVGTSSAFDSLTNLQVKQTSGSNRAYLDLQSSFASTVAGQGVGTIRFLDSGNAYRANISCESDGASSSSSDAPGRLVFATTADGASSPTEQMRLTSNGYLRLGDGTTYYHTIRGAGGNEALEITANAGQQNAVTAGTIKFLNSNSGGAITERLRITNSGAMFLGDIGNSLTVSGFNCQAPTDDFYGSFVNTSSNSAVRVLQVNRQTSDGNLVDLRQANTLEGTISVSGSTVTYGGGHLARWSQLPNGEDPSTILKGTVMSNLDEMCEWGDEDNEQLNKTKVSDVEGDPNVAGVFVSTSFSEDGPLDFFVAMTGDMIIRIAEGVTVQRGQLLMSAGDGTAKPQDDDIIRSKTIAKVTSTHVTFTYEDGSYCVPCVLMAC